MIPLRKGHIYVAAGDYHLEIRRTEEGLCLFRSSNGSVNGHRPSVDVLFQSIAKYKIPSLAVLLTGMGKDGASGLKALAETNLSFTMAQDRKSSVVFGMPKVAIELGAACFVGNIDDIKLQLLKRISQ
jgi:two-component system chemotaxis response regulator CheB